MEGRIRIVYRRDLYIQPVAVWSTSDDDAHQKAIEAGLRLASLNSTTV